MSDGEILSLIGQRMREDRGFRGSLMQAVETKNDSWLRSLLRGALSVLKTVGEFALGAVIASLFGL